MHPRILFALALTLLLNFAGALPRARCQAPQGISREGPIAFVAPPPTLAATSLRGPRTEIALGTVVLTATPLLMTMAWIATDPENGPNTDFPVASVTGAVVGGFGLFLLAHGIRRSAQIQRARTRLAGWGPASFAAGPRQASLQLGFSF
jgi:hypothetical protein